MASDRRAKLGQWLTTVGQWFYCNMKTVRRSVSQPFSRRTSIENLADL